MDHLITQISFSGSDKEEISGIDLQNGLSAIFFQQYGRVYRLAEVQFKFPHPLGKDETADVILRHLKDLTLRGIIFRVFNVKMVGRDSLKTVCSGRFTAVPK